MIKAIAFTWYPVRDTKRARAFYEGTFGLRLARREARDFELGEYDLEDKTFQKQDLDEASHWHCAK